MSHPEKQLTTKLSSTGLVENEIRLGSPDHQDRSSPPPANNGTHSEGKTELIQMKMGKDELDKAEMEKADMEKSETELAELDKAEEASDGPPDRANWDSKLDYMLSVVGFAVDLSNVWRFPFICYKNGGGAFLIPYAIMAVVGGVPLLYLELALGQYQQTGIMTVWEKICPILSGLGFATCLVNLYVSFYYNTVIAWSMYYVFSSFTAVLPWTTCNNTWNTDDCATGSANFTPSNTSVTPASEFYERRVLGLTDDVNIGNLGGVKWDLSLCLLAVFLVVFFSLWKGIKASGKVVWVTATLPYVCLVVLLVRGVTLEGASNGIYFYLNPKWELLLAPGVWMDAAVQVFFSLGPGFGVMLAFSSYSKFHNNCYLDSVVVSFINCATSFVSGFAIFSVLGYMAMKEGTTVEEVATEGYGLVFVAYAEALSTLPAPQVLSIIFFLMIITLGLDSTFGGLESIITGCVDKWPRVVGKHRAIFVASLLVVCFCGSLTTVTYGGQYVILLFDNYAVSVTILAVVAVETLAISWMYGVYPMSNDIKEMIGHKPGIYWLICWKFLSPAAIIFIVIFGLVFYSPIPNWPRWAEAIGWILTSSSIACVPIYAVYRLIVTPGSFKERLHKCFHPQVKERKVPNVSNFDSKAPIADV